MPKCYHCAASYEGIGSLQRHLRFVHKLDQNDKYKCGETNCFKTASDWKAFRRHLLNFHIFPVTGSSCSVPDVDVSIAEPDCVSVPQNSTENDCLEPLPESSEALSKNLQNDLQQHASLLVAKLYSKSGMPRKQVQDYVDHTSEFVSHALSTVQVCVNRELENSNIDPEVIRKISGLFVSLSEPFSELTTEHRRIKFLTDKGFYIPPEEYKIYPDMFRKTLNKRVVMELDFSTGVKVPLRITLKKFMELPNVFSIIVESLHRESHPCVISDFVNGSFWKSKRVKYGDKLVLPLYVYYDEFQCDKEIGLHSAKLGAVYVRPACLPAEYQGAVDNIFLASYFDYDGRVNYGTRAVFRNIVDELNYLKNDGIDVVLDDGSLHKVHFVVELVLGDNLALHIMLGFSESFSANYPCRMCHVHKSVLVNQSVEDPTLLRDKVQHVIDIATDNLSSTGVAEPSALENLEDFDPTDNPGVDELHDLWEGAFKYGMQHVVYYFTFQPLLPGSIKTKQYFTLDDLNFRILTFQYSPEVSNRVPQLKDKHIKQKKLRMTGSELKTFVRTFALLDGDFVDENDPVWEYYLIIREIFDILMCKCIQAEMCNYLNKLISRHHTLPPIISGSLFRPGAISKSFELGS